MTKHSLSTYLMLSVLIILSGILWVVFSQIDRSYKYPILIPDIQKEHNEIIHKIYQLEAEETVVENNAAALSPGLATAQNIAIEILEGNSSTSTQITTPNTNATINVWSSSSNPAYEPAYSLRNNPWSPEYKPGY